MMISTHRQRGYAAYSALIFILLAALSCISVLTFLFAIDGRLAESSSFVQSLERDHDTAAAEQSVEAERSRRSPCPGLR